MKLKSAVMLSVGVALGAISINPVFAGKSAKTLKEREDKIREFLAEKRYIVSFKDSIKGAEALRRAGGKVALALPRRKMVAAHIPANALEGLRKNPQIEYIEEDQIRLPLTETTPYGISMIQADLLSDASASNVTACIIDSGFYQGHEDLQNANVTTSPDIGTGDPLEDGCGHGTHVGGTIAGLSNDTGVVGVNPNGNLKLHIVKVFGNDCGWSYSSTLVKALDECSAQSGKIVVNMSLGGSFKSRTEERAFNDAYAAGVLSIAAAGNDGNTRKSYPASYSSVVSVAAVDSNKEHGSFSQVNDQVEISAPGVAVLSTVPWNSDSRININGSDFTGSSIEFSATTDSLGVSGTLVDGGLCDSVGSYSGSIVLCERGTVSFYDKVANAQAGGAVAAIIYNNAPGGFAGTLGDGNTSSIPAISLSQEDGQGLVASELGQSGTVFNVMDKPGSGYEAWDGTSMATPHVAGAAALLWSNNLSASNEEIRNAITASAEDLGPAGRDTSFGFGLIQVSDAHDYLQSGPTCIPTEVTELSCTDGQDNDCDGFVDSQDSDCDSTPGGSCELGQIGESCTVSSDCCTNNCKGKPGQKTCK